MKVLEEENLEKHIEKQMGCMAGFFQIFDRHQVLAGKRIYSTRRLPSSPSTSSTSQSERSDASPPPFAKESPPSPSPATPKNTQVSTPTEAAAPRTPLPLPVFEFKEGSKTMWKLREAPRLSLDSRLVEGKSKLYPRQIRTTPVAKEMQSDGSDLGDDQDKQRRSPSVVARLMGLDLLPENGGRCDGGAITDVPFRKPVLRRSASESRVSRDLLPLSFLPTEEITPLMKPNAKSKTKATPAKKAPQAGAPVQRKSFFDTQDFFPEPAKRSPSPASANGGIGGGVSLYGEIEKRLRMRGIDEPAKDLETLKQILEALQLKGLLHPGRREDRRNIVYEAHCDSANRSPIVLMKPSTASNRRSTSPAPAASRLSASPTRKNLASDARPMRDRQTAERKLRSTAVAEVRSPSSLARRRVVNTDRKTSPAQSPRSAAHSPRRAMSEPVTARSPRSRKPPPAPSQIEISDESSTVSESSYSATSHFDLERVKTEEYRQGRHLLERCDKLLHSIAEITTASGTASATASAEMSQQPSPVSVLDSAASFYCDDTGSPSPAAARKRCIDFKDRELEREELEVEPWSLPLATEPIQLLRLRPVAELNASDRDFEYVVDVLRLLNSERASPQPLDVFLCLEKHHQMVGCSKASRLHRRLVFDTVVEVLDEKTKVSSWESFARSRLPSGRGLEHGVAAEDVWAEIRRIKEKVPAEDLCDLVCGVLRKDIAGCKSGDERCWGDRSMEMSDAVLDIERLIFKDLVAEAIKDLAAASPLPPSHPPPLQKCRSAAAVVVPRRKLVF